MGTLNTTLKQFIVTASANADFQALCTLIHNFMVTTCGMTQTADTGQINPASVSFPGSNNTDAGDLMYAMADALQSTYPVIIKWTLGRGSDANTARFNITIGMGSTNGARVFVGTQMTNGVFVSLSASSTRTVADTTLYRIVGSGSTSRFVISFFPDTLTSPRGCIISLERTRDNTGANTGDGILFYFTNSGFGSNSLANGYAATLAFDIPQVSGVIRTDNPVLSNLFLNIQNWGQTARSQQDTLSSVRNGKRYAAPFYGLHRFQYPFINMLLGCNGDWPQDYSTSLITIYGSSQTYMNLGAGAAQSFPNGTGTGILMRFD